MQALLALVAVNVAGAGNVRGQPGGSVNANLYPAIAAANYPNIVVFGSVDTCGEEASDPQQGPLVSVWSPGVDLECAANVDRGSQQETGASMRRAWFLGFMALNPARFPEPGTERTAGAVKDRITEEA